MEAVCSAHAPRTPVQSVVGNATVPRGRACASVSERVLLTPTFCPAFSSHKRDSFYGDFLRLEAGMKRSGRARQAACVRNQVEHAPMSKVYARHARTAPVHAAGQGTIAIKGSKSARKQHAQESDAANQEVS